MFDSFIDIWICYLLSRGRCPKSDEYGKLVWKMRQQGVEGFMKNINVIPREARRAEGPPSVARFINLSCGVRARIA